ncbi:SET domain-containing protein [Ramaria rubella]|nr:SET domain-containing protein [Ramaria rubella]
MIGMGVLGLVAKLHEWDESAIFFDGSSLANRHYSIALYVFGVIIYSSVTIGGLRTIVNPAVEDTEPDRIEALRVLSAGNTLIILCLIGVLCLQVRRFDFGTCPWSNTNMLFKGGQEYARRLQIRLEAQAKAKSAATEAYMLRGVPYFLCWCTEHGIEIDERLEIRVSPLDDSMSVFSRANASIGIGESLVSIPKSIVFSAKNCTRSRDVPASSCHDPSLELSLAFMLEVSVGPSSPWHGYISSLPKDAIDIAMFWGINGDRDGIEARKWLQGTEAEKILSPHLGQKPLDRINTYFVHTVEPTLRRLSLPRTLKDFHHAYSIVSSRAFLIDAYHGLSLVPIADAFDHVEDNQVHLESDYHVCVTCGSLEECGHDTTDNLDNSPAVAYNKVDTCEMVANLPIGPGEEVFNTYEKGLTNAQLLCQYGFILDGNENNTVTWSVDELIFDAAKPEKTFALWRELATEWTSQGKWDDSQLVYTPCRDEVDEDGVPKGSLGPCWQLDLNADGQISHELWLLVFAFVSADVDVGTHEARTRAVQVARAQARIESELSREATKVDPEDECRRTLDLTQKVAERIVQICEWTMGSAHCAGISEERLGDILDEMDMERRLTRRAICYALEERKMLQTCCIVWREVAARCC